MKKNFVKKSSAKNTVQKVLTGLIAIFMSLTLFSGCFVLFKKLDKPVPEIQNGESDKRDWEDFSVDHLDGEGTENSPWEISNAEDLAFLSSSMTKLKDVNADTNKIAVTRALSGVSIETIASDTQIMALATSEEAQEENYFTFTSDINLSNYRWNPIPALNGVLDGNGHTLDIGERVFSDEDLKNPVYKLDENGYGIAPFVGENTSISNIHVSGTMTTSVVTGSQKQEDSGAGWSQDGFVYVAGYSVVNENNKTLNNVVVDVNIKHTSNFDGDNSVLVGGIVAINCGMIKNCMFRGEIEVCVREWNERRFVSGGICASNCNGVIMDCLNYGSINLRSLPVNWALSHAEDGVVGGICGESLPMMKSYDGDLKTVGLNRYAFHDDSWFNNSLESTYRSANGAIVRCVNFGTVGCWLTDYTVDSNQTIYACGGIVGKFGGWEFSGAWSWDTYSNGVYWQRVEHCVNFGTLRLTGTAEKRDPPSINSGESYIRPRRVKIQSGGVGGIIGMLRFGYGTNSTRNCQDAGMMDCVNYGNVYRNPLTEIDNAGIACLVGNAKYTKFSIDTRYDNINLSLSGANFGYEYCVRYSDADPSGSHPDYMQEVAWGHSTQTPYNGSNYNDVVKIIELSASDLEKDSQHLPEGTDELNESLKRNPFATSLYNSSVTAALGEKITINSKNTYFIPISALTGVKFKIRGQNPCSSNYIDMAMNLNDFSTKNLGYYDSNKFCNEAFLFPDSVLYSVLYCLRGYDVGVTVDCKNHVCSENNEDYVNYRYAIYDIRNDAQNKRTIYDENRIKLDIPFATQLKMNVFDWKDGNVPNYTKGSPLYFNEIIFKSTYIQRADTLDSVKIYEYGKYFTPLEPEISFANLSYSRRTKTGITETGDFNLLERYDSSTHYTLNEDDKIKLRISPKVGYAIASVGFNNNGNSTSSFITVYNGTSKTNRTPSANYTNESGQSNASIQFSLGQGGGQNVWSDYYDYNSNESNDVWLGDIVLTATIPRDMKAMEILSNLYIYYKPISYKVMFYSREGEFDKSYPPNSSEKISEQALSSSNSVSAFQALSNLNPGLRSGYIASVKFYDINKKEHDEEVMQFELMSKDVLNEFGRSAYTYDYGTISLDKLLKGFISDTTSDCFYLCIIQQPRNFSIEIESTYNDWNHLEEFTDVRADMGLRAGIVHKNDISGIYYLRFNTNDNDVSIACGLDSTQGYQLSVVEDDFNKKFTTLATDKNGLPVLSESGTWGIMYSIDVQKLADAIYMNLAKSSNAGTYFQNFKDCTLYNDLLASARSYVYQGQFKLQQFTLNGEIKSVDGKSGTITVATYSSEKLSVNNYKTSDTKIFSNNGSMKVYYNAPVILTATNESDFGGFYLVKETDLGEQEFLLTNKNYFHFFVDVKDAIKIIDSDVFKADLGKIHIKAVYGLNGQSENKSSKPATEQGVLMIKNASEMVWLSEQMEMGETFSGRIIKMCNDIDMQNVPFNPIGTNVNNAFQGTFDGQFHHIKNLLVTSAEATNRAYGLFGFLGDGAVVKNLILESGNVSCISANVGALVGYAKNATISRVENYGVNVGGGISGFFDIFTNPTEKYILFHSTVQEEITNNIPSTLYVNPDTHAIFYTERPFKDNDSGIQGSVGGLIGEADSVSMIGCSNRAEVNGGGGLIGDSTKTTLNQCFSTTGDKLNSVGTATFTNCYLGEISGKYNMSLSISNVWSSESTLSQNSKIWTIVNGNIALKIFYWDT